MSDTPIDPTHHHVSGTEWARLQEETRRHREEEENSAHGRTGLSKPLVD